MSKTINSKIKLRNDTATNWTNNNPVLAAGEMGIESDTRKFKFGDGTTSWNNLNYVVSQREQVFISAQSALTVGTATVPATILYNITSDHSVASIYNLQSADYIINYNGVVFNNVQVIKTQLDTTQYKIEIIFFDEEYQYIIIGQTDSTGLVDTWDFNDAGFVTTDTNTTYSLSISGSRITLTPNSGTSSYVDIPSPDLSNYMLKTDMVAITNAEIDTICV